MASNIPGIDRRVTALEERNWGTEDSFTSSNGTATETGYLLADGTDLADIFLNSSDVIMKSTGTGGFVTDVSLDTSVEGKVTFTKTKGAVSYCSYCSYCSVTGYCSYCTHCSYCRYCNGSSTCSNCGDN